MTQQHHSPETSRKNAPQIELSSTAIAKQLESLPPLQTGETYQDPFNNNVFNTDGFWPAAAITLDGKALTLYRSKTNECLLAAVPDQADCAWLPKATRIIDQSQLGQKKTWAQINPKDATAAELKDVEYYRLNGLLLHPDLRDQETTLTKLLDFKSPLVLDKEFLLSQIEAAAKLARQFTHCGVIFGGAVRDGVVANWQKSKFDTVAEYYAKHPETTAIIATGRGAAMKIRAGSDSYNLTEAGVFSEILKNGYQIPSSAIYQEINSVNSITNLLFSFFGPDLKPGPFLQTGMPRDLSFAPAMWQAIRITAFADALFGPLKQEGLIDDWTVARPTPTGFGQKLPQIYPEETMDQLDGFHLPKEADIRLNIAKETAYADIEIRRFINQTPSDAGRILATWFDVMMTAPDMTGAKTVVHEEIVSWTKRHQGLADSY